MTNDDLETPVPFGRYTLEHRLATGGMAEIFLARQEGPGGFSRELVIKRILPHYAGEAGFVEMFLDEAKLAARLNHPNIVPIYDFGEVDGSWFLAMELVRGPDLRNVLEAEQAADVLLPFGTLARIIADAAQGLEHAHRLVDDKGKALNIIHRDISPSNIIVSYDGVTKILDFGIAKADQTSHKTRTGFIKGKFAYMSPEQIQGDPLDARADIYSLGIVLFELCARRPPFAEDSDFRLMRTICENPAPSPREFAPDVPEALEKIILKAIAKDREDRFRSGRELAIALERFAISHGGPVSIFDVSEALLDLKEAYGEPLTVLAQAGLTDGSGNQESIRVEKPAIEGDKGDSASGVGAEDALPAAASGPSSPDSPDEEMLSARGSSPGADDATVLRPGLPRSNEADKSHDSAPAAGDDATVLRPGLPRSTSDGDGEAPSGSAPNDRTVESPGLPGGVAYGHDPKPGKAVPSGTLAEPTNVTARPPLPARGTKKKGFAARYWPIGAAVGVLAAFAVLIGFVTAKPEDADHDAKPFSVTDVAKTGKESAEQKAPLEGDQLAVGPEDGSDEIIDDPLSADPESDFQDEDAIATTDGELSPALQPPDGEATPPGHQELLDGPERSSTPESPLAATGPTALDAPSPAPARPARDPDRKSSAPQAPATGYVMVQSRPWSNIHFGDEVLGSTPLRVELPVGRQEIVLRHPESGLERSVTVQVRRGQTSRASVSLGEGRVAFLVRPYGEVWIGGEKRGMTPMPPLVLPAGRHTIELVHPETGRRKQESIEVLHDETVTLRVDLSD